ncbi:MAG: amidohydrolase family protein [Acidimicrobiia bacterium]|nr:amidohydrolase family protein [Acidimicrobiia bacterium]
MPVIDIHCHRECSAAAEMMKSEAQGRTPMSFGSELTREVNRRQLAYIRPKMESLEERIADMDRMGVDIQAVAIAPYQTFYWAEPELGSKVSRIINDDLAEAVSRYPNRFVGLGTVPLQDTAAAVDELGRCMDQLGFRGLEIATNVQGEELSSPRLDPFWAAVEKRGAVIFIHPVGFTHPQRFTEHYFFNVIGHPIENTLAISNLIFGGVMERYPALKIVMAHGGGYLPAYAGRMDHAYHAREDVRHGLPKPPGAYLRQFHFDTMVFEPDQMSFLATKYGADHILLGTDYPYDMGETDPVGLVSRTPGLSDEDRKAICGGNAARLLGLVDGVGGR